jgi:hypothetical protein
LVRRHYPVLAQISLSYSEPKGRFPRVTHPCATKPEGFVRLACVRHAASVRSEPGSNSQVCVTTLQSRIETRQTAAPNFRSRYLHLSNVMDTKDNVVPTWLTGIRSLKTPGPGAVAHMSLHLKPTMSKNPPDNNRRTTNTPRSSGRRSCCPSMLATRETSQ